MDHEAIIIGGNHHNTLGVIRALGYKGISSLVLLVTDEEKPFVSYSKYIRECVILPSKNDIVPYLQNYANKLSEKAVILSCADFVTSELDMAYDKLKENFYLPTAIEQGKCNYYMDKAVMAELAIRTGVNVPKSWIIKSDTETDLSSIALPCIIKPLASINGSKSDIQICFSKEELSDYFSSKQNISAIVQEYIEKDFEYQLIGCSLNHGEEIIIPGYSKCIRPCPGTNTGFLEYKPWGDFNCNLTACKEFIKAIGYQGLFSMEYLRDKHGKDYFMEINMRNDGNGICVTGAGVNLPYIWYQCCIGKDYKEEANHIVNDIFVMPEMDDFMLMLKRKVSYRTWRRDYKRTTTFMEYCPTDPKPYKVRKNQFIKHLLKKVLHLK